jgi:hypothetical protein
MKELKELSANYATEKTNEMVSQIVAQAFADGYRMGYKDREDEIPVDLRDGKAEFVDLGLPSGTLWSTSYETVDERIIFLPFMEAMSYSLPSEDQWKELMSVCRWSSRSVGNTTREYKCIGPNGNSLSFFSVGMMSTGKMYTNRLFFWLKDNGENIDKNSASAYLSDKIDPQTHLKILEIILTKTFMGYKLPIRLVKSK